MKKTAWALLAICGGLAGCTTATTDRARDPSMFWYRADGRPDNIAEGQMAETACVGYVEQIRLSAPQTPLANLDTIMNGCMAERGYLVGRR